MGTKIAVIILAAGNGDRMNKQVNKLFLDLNGKPVLAHTLEAFEKAGLNEEIIVVLKPDEFKLFEETVQKPYQFNNVKLVEGGKTRQDSAHNGLAALSEDTDIVLIHDGARPFVSQEIIDDCIQKVKESGSAIASVPAVATIKFSQNNRDINYSPPREHLFEAQTPQGFSYPLIMQALTRMDDDMFPVTDDSSILEHLGYKPRLSKGEKTNIKITTPDDLTLAQAIAEILKSRGDNGI